MLLVSAELIGLDMSPHRHGGNLAGAYIVLMLMMIEAPLR